MRFLSFRPHLSGTWVALFLFAMVLLFYPLSLFAPIIKGIPIYWVVCLDPGLFSALCVSILLLFPVRFAEILEKNPVLAAAILFLTIWTFLQFGLGRSVGVSGYFRSLSFVVIPLVTRIHFRSFYRMFPAFLFFLWSINMVHCLTGFTWSGFITGLPGNSNWNAILLVCTTPAALYVSNSLLLKLVPDRRILRYGCLVLFTVTSLFLLYFCSSRGASLALIGSASACLLFSLSKQNRNRVLLAIIPPVLFLTVLFVLRGTDALARIIADDVRLCLWQSTLDIIRENIFTGTGWQGFENELMSHRTLEYFQNRHAATISNHPHNHLLFFAASFGLPALVCWFFLLFYPLILNLLRFHRERNIRMKLATFAFLALLIHGQFDLVVFEWPGNVLFLMLLGILWGRAWKRAEHDPMDGIRFPLLSRICQVTAFLILATVLYESYRNLTSSHAFSKGLLVDGLNPALASFYYKTSYDQKPDCRSVYEAGINAFDELSNPSLAVSNFTQVLECPFRSNYAHANGFLGLSLCRQERYTEAIEYLIQETRLYPLSVGAWYNLGITYHGTGDRERAANCRKMVSACLAEKGFSEKDLPTILANPRYDHNPRLFFKERNMQPQDTP